MSDKEYINYLKERRITEHETFLQGNNKYFILKQSKESIIYNNNTEIYKYNDQHDEFLKSLPFITDKLSDLEAELKKYYNNANSANYNHDHAHKHLINILYMIQKIHIFFRVSDNALLYIRRVLYEHFCKMVEYRFLIYINLNVKDESEIILQDLENFRSEDHKFFNNLFFPIYQLMEEKKARKLKECKMAEYSRMGLYSLWNYWGYISHCPNNLNQELPEDRLERYRRENYINMIKKQASDCTILKDLKIIENIFTDYFSVFSNLQGLYTQTSIFHQYALILSNSFLYSNLIDSCTYYSNHQSMYKIITEYICKTNPNRIILYSQVPKDFTDDLYQRIKDSIDADSDTTTEIEKEILYYYPSVFEKYMGTQLIEFHSFEQLIAIELLDIIMHKTIIKKCHHCNCYFITGLKKQIYCEQHKNNHIIQQQSYLQKKRFVPLYQLIFEKYNTCLAQRKTRGKLSKADYENWKKDAIEFISKHSPKDLSEEALIAQLNSICQKYAIPPCRKYSKQLKKSKD